MPLDQPSPESPTPLPKSLEGEALINHWLHVTSPMGQIQQTGRWHLKRLAWRLVTGLAHGLKRLLDILGAVGALLLLSPVFAVTAFMVKRGDGGPIFFGQQRVGFRGRPFRMWKFRSMVLNADKIKDQLMAQNEMAGGVIFKMKNDPRVTPVGRFIRKYSIDEFPQFWNVLMGEMSLVGPRPAVPREVAEYPTEARQRLLAKPGLTCFWQVGGRSQIDFTGQVELDVAYIRSQSFWLDVLLLLKTVPAVLLGKGAY